MILCCLKCSPPFFSPFFWFFVCLFFCQCMLLKYNSHFKKQSLFSVPGDIWQALLGKEEIQRGKHWDGEIRVGRDEEMKIKKKTNKSTWVLLSSFIRFFLREYLGQIYLGHKELVVVGEVKTLSIPFCYVLVIRLEEETPQVQSLIVDAPSSHKATTGRSVLIAQMQTPLHSSARSGGFWFFWQDWWWSFQPCSAPLFACSYLAFDLSK